MAEVERFQASHCACTLISPDSAAAVGCVNARSGRKEKAGRTINIRYPGESDAKKMVVLQRFWGKCEEILRVQS